MPWAVGMYNVLDFCSNLHTKYIFNTKFHASYIVCSHFHSTLKTFKNFTEISGRLEPTTLLVAMPLIGIIILIIIHKIVIKLKYLL